MPPWADKLGLESFLPPFPQQNMNLKRNLLRYPSWSNCDTGHCTRRGFPSQRCPPSARKMWCRPRLLWKVYCNEHIINRELEMYKKMNVKEYKKLSIPYPHFGDISGPWIFQFPLQFSAASCTLKLNKQTYYKHYQNYDDILGKWASEQLYQIDSFQVVS